MAKVEVGCQLKWQGKPVICTSIRTTTETWIARTSSTIMRTEMATLANVKILVQEWDDFEEGDIITTKLQVMELTEPGHNLYFVYTYYKVTQEKLNGSERLEAGNGEASYTEAKADSRRNQSGESSGIQSTDQNSSS